MRAVCPSCEAVYEVPDRLIGAGGRRLRCTNCGHEWTLLLPAAERPAAPPPPFKETPPPPYDRLAQRAEPPPPARPVLRRPPQVIDPPLPPVDDTTGRRSRRAEAELRAAWIGSVLLVVLALGALWVFRYEIAAAWPPAARLVGAPPTGGG